MINNLSSWQTTAPINNFSSLPRALTGIIHATLTVKFFFREQTILKPSMVGVLTYSRKVMATVGEGLMKLSPVSALAVVSAHSLVLFLFASQGLEAFLQRNGLPTIPLVPVSSSQAIVGAVIGLGLLKRGKGIRCDIINIGDTLQVKTM